MTGAGRLWGPRQGHLRGIREHFSRYLGDAEACTLEKALGLIADAATRPSDKAC